MKHSEESEAGKYDDCRVAVYPCFQPGSHESQILCPFNQKEINNGSGAYAAEQSDFPLQPASIFECEYHSGYKLHKGPEEKAIATDRKMPNITDRAFSVFSSSSKPSSTACHFYESHNERRPQKARIPSKRLWM